MRRDDDIELTLDGDGHTGDLGGPDARRLREALQAVMLTAKGDLASTLGKASAELLKPDGDHRYAAHLALEAASVRQGGGWLELRRAAWALQEAA